MTPLIGLVSGTYNRLALLQGMIASFRANIPDGISYTITLIDGGSTDGTLEWARAQADVTLIEDGELRGAISAFTRGAYATDARYIIMANDDIEFAPGSVMRAFVHLEDHPGCGGVAFADNRPVPPYIDDTVFKVLEMPGLKNGQRVSIIYAQVGMFRKWLGDKADWWGANTAMRLARTYGGDNHLSGHIWRLGYSVDKVEGCRVIDYVANDELRVINGVGGKQITNLGDSEYYYRQWHGNIGGPTIPMIPTEPQQDVPLIRVLYLPIIDPGWAIAKQTKRGLREALERATTPKGWRLAVRELDYFAVPEAKLEATLLRAADEFQPRLILTQIQAHLPLSAGILAKLRNQHPRASIINWNGDYWPGGLTSPEMLAVLRQVDLQLTVNASSLETYQQRGIPAAYWQIGYEEPGDDLPEAEAHDVVFLGNCYSEQRKGLWDVITSFANHDCNVGVYGSGWAAADGMNLYDFAAGKAIYQKARIAIGDSQFPDAYGYVSNRLFQMMAAGGCLCLHQRVAGLKELTGLLAGTHYIEWADLDDLRGQLSYWLDPAHEDERKRIADAGTRFVRQFHSFDARVGELFELIRLHLQPHRDVETNAVSLRYVGRSSDPFGVKGMSTGLQYEYKPGQLLLVDKLDAPFLLARHDLWEAAG